MILRLSPEEFAAMRTALEEYRRSLREQARPILAGYSEQAIELCSRRLVVEALLGDLDQRHIAYEAVDAKVVEMPLRTAVSSASPERAA